MAYAPWSDDCFGGSESMPLVHYSEQNGVRSKENQFLEFHWEKLRPDVAKDVAIAKSAEYVSK